MCAAYFGKPGGNGWWRLWLLVLAWCLVFPVWGEAGPVPIAPSSLQAKHNTAAMWLEESNKALADAEQRLSEQEQLIVTLQALLTTHAKSLEEYRKTVIDRQIATGVIAGISVGALVAGLITMVIAQFK